ncbi:MAG: aldolase/citrate lyase family protein [Myxococcales bacterium]
MSGAEFKAQLRAGQPKIGLFLNSHSPTVAEQLAHTGYDWLLVDTQHGPMDHERLGAMLCAVGSGGAKSLVRVGGYDDRAGIQQSLDLGADGVLVPYINTAEEARAAVELRRYPTAGTRSVYFPQRSTNKDGLLGYVGNANKNVVVALQVETAELHREHRRDRGRPRRGHAVPGPERPVHVDGAVREVRVPAHVHVPRIAGRDRQVDRGRPQERRDLRRVPVRHRPRAGVPEQGLQPGQHRQRFAPRAHPGRAHVQAIEAIKPERGEAWKRRPRRPL